MSLLPGSVPLDPTNRGLRSRIFSWKTMEVGQGDLSGALRVILGRVSQPGWFVDSFHVFTATALSASATDYWTLKPLSIEGRRESPVYRALDPGVSTMTRILPADVGMRIHAPERLGYALPVDAVLAVDLAVTGTPANLEAPTFQAILSFGG